MSIQCATSALAETYHGTLRFGPSLITREGKSWRAHQRILAPTFTERNAELVWEESIVQAEQMLKSWLNIQSTESRCIPDIRADTMMLPFNVINKAGFGVDLPWSVESNLSSHKVTAGSADTAARGHQMTYREALHSVISHLFHIIIFPSWLLRIIPFEYARRLRIAHMESVAYLKELIKRKEEELRGSQTGPKRKYRSDLMSALVSTKLEHETKLASEALEDEEALTESAILANVFLMMIAGHETTATILLLTLVELAINLEWQHEVQKDLDETFGQRPTISWNLRNDIARLSGGTVGATINEILRLYPPANIIPKGTRAGSAQTMRSGPQEFTIPGNTALQILTVSTHHNPKFWRSYSASFEAKDDLGEFRPQRWSPETGLTSNDYRRPQVSEITQEGGILRSEVSTSLFRPYPGAFIPFSVGQRGCIGRRFAQVELLAVIAVIFRTYSLELDVRDVSADEVIDKMSPEERKVVYDRARAETRKVTQEGMRHHLTMQLKAGKLALRLVGRGEERFFDAYTRK